MDAKLKALYQDVILKHDKSPINYEKRSEADVTIEAYNPLCGDQFQLYLEVKDDLIQQAHFHGYGCAISKASTSVLVQNLKGKKWAEVASLIQNFQAVITKQEHVVPQNQDFEAFAAVQQFPGRMPCVTLSWNNLNDFLKSL